MRKQRPFRPGQIESLEERRVPSSLAHVPTGAVHAASAHIQRWPGRWHHHGINIHAPYVSVHVGHRVVVHAPFFYGSFPGIGGFGPVVIRAPGFFGVFP
jgi:hypothetical protein